MKTVALVEPFTGGHRLSFNGYFIKALLDLNYRVLVCYPNIEQIKEYLLLKGICSESVFAIKYNFRRGQSKSGLPFFGEIIDCIREWQNVNRHIKKAELEYGISVHHVFFSWMDSYLQNYTLGILLRLFFNREWSGLYFHPKHMYQSKNLRPKVFFSDIDILLSSRNCKGVAVHDRGLLNSYHRRIGRMVVLFPEIADLTPPNVTNKMSLEIKKKSRDRHIVGLIGLTPYKGLGTLIRMAQRADPKKFFFVIVGDLPLERYPESDRELISRYITSEPENSFIHLKNINEGEEFNSVFNCFDTPFLVYNNFYSTSNNLTKASFLNKKVIASKGYSIGADVEKYLLGITVKQGDIDECLTALERLIGEKELSSESLERFKQYAELNSEQHLSNCFRYLIESQT